ncbi:MAG: hypothetical protein EPO00_05555 [Chloroflexota bacterium]|nr:MAG: hypothetical protein EPO00_05555 [Chloroflexota bacterium]
MKPDGVEAPVGPVLGTPRRARDRARIALVGAAAVVVVGVGIGLAGHGFTSPAPSPSPRTSATSGAVASASAGPSGTSGTLPPPTQNTGLGCTPVRLGVPPEILLGLEPGDPRSIRGTPATATGTGTDAPAWPTPGAAGALRLSAGTTISVLADQDACMRYVVAEYLPGAPGVTLPYPVAFRTVNISPPRSILPLGQLPSGDWVVRVVAYFSTGSSGDDGGTVLERYFRVINSAAPVPIPSPLATPAVACAPPPPGGVPPSLVLAGARGGPVEGTPGAATPPLVAVRIGEPLEIRVVGDACAIGWTLTGSQPETGFDTQFDQEQNTANNPFLYAQNRWALHDLPTGRVTVGATIRFSADVSITRRWLIDVAGADVPSIRIATPTGTTVPAIQSLCGATWAFDVGASGFEFCGASEVPDGLPVLSVPPETPLRIEAPGWTIRTWGGSCGRLDPAANGQMLSVNGCDLGGWFASGLVPIPGPAVFLPRTTGPLVRLFVQAERNGTTATVVVFLTVLASP